MILLLALKADLHSQYIHEILKTKKEKSIFYSFDQYPTKSNIDFKINKNNTTLILKSSDGILDLAEIKSFLYRLPAKSIASSSRYKNLKKYIEKESSILLESLPSLTPQSFWLPNPDIVTLAERKPYQLRIAREVGFSIPETVIGNNPEAVEEFASQHTELSLKPLYSPNFSPDLTVTQKLRKLLYNIRKGNGFRIDDPEDIEKPVFSYYMTILNQKYSTQEILAQASQFQNCPVILQSYIPKNLELRITIVGTKIFACALYSQTKEVDEEFRADWRTIPSGDFGHEIFYLPPEIQEKCLNFMKRLKLDFGCIDMILTPTGEYVFLEVNPNGQWLWIEEKTGMPIGEAITSLLIDPTL